MLTAYRPVVRSLLPPQAGEVDLDARYALADPGPGRRHVRAGFVASVDGAIELDGRSGGLGGAADRAVFRMLRWSCDVVLVGAGTVRAEDYGPAVVPDARQRLRRERGMAAVPRVAVVSASGALDSSARLFAAGPHERPLVLTSAHADPAAVRALRDVAEVVVCGDAGLRVSSAADAAGGAVDAARLLDALTERGLRRILCEGGPTLLATLAGDGHLDELCLTVAPVLAGPGHARLLTGPPWQRPADLALASVLEQDGVLLLRYARS